MPESIGSKKRVLQPGIVCDRCNNYFAIKIEQPILSHPSMRNLRAWYQVPNKRGKYPSVLGHITGTEIKIGLGLGPDGLLRVEPERARDREHLDSVMGSGLAGNLATPLLFKFEMDPPKREMSRFLCKMALETIAETFSLKAVGTEELVDEPFFDDVRSFARYGNNYPEWPYSQRRIFPEETVMRHSKTNEWVQVGFGCRWFMNGHKETLFAFCFYGVEFVINIGGPSITGYLEWLIEHDNISPVVEGVGFRILTEGEGQSKRYFLHKESDTKI
jgi:hypothetical protein